MSESIHLKTNIIVTPNFWTVMFIYLIFFKENNYATHLFKKIWIIYVKLVIFSPQFHKLNVKNAYYMFQSYCNIFCLFEWPRLKKYPHCQQKETEDHLSTMKQEMLFAGT